MANTLDNVIVQLEARLSKLESDLRQAVKKSEQAGQQAGDSFADRFGRSIGRIRQDLEKLGNNLPALLGGAGLVAGLKGAAEQAAKAEASMRVFGAVVERTGQGTAEANKVVSQLADRFGVLPSVVQENITLLLRQNFTLEQAAQALSLGAASALAFGKDAAAGFEGVAQAASTGLSIYLNYIGIAENLGPALQKVETATKNLSEEQQKQAKAQAMVNLLQKAAGDELRTVDVFLQSYSGSMSRLNRALSEFAVEIGRNVLPVLLRIVETGTRLLQGFNALPDPVRNAASAFAIGAAGMTALATAAGVLVTALGPLAGPAGLLVLAAGGLAALVSALSGANDAKRNLEQLKAAFADLDKHLGPEQRKVWDEYGKSLKKIGKDAQEAKDQVVDAVAKMVAASVYGAQIIRLNEQKASLEAQRAVEKAILENIENQLKLRKEAGISNNAVLKAIQEQIDKQKEVVALYDRQIRAIDLAVGKTKEMALVEFLPKALREVFGTGAGGASSNFTAAATAADKLTERLADLERSMQAGIISQSAYRSGLSQLVREADALRKGLKAGSDEWDKAVDVMGRAKSALETLDKAAQKGRESTKDLSQSIEYLSNLSRSDGLDPELWRFYVTDGATQAIHDRARELERLARSQEQLNKTLQKWREIGSDLPGITGYSTPAPLLADLEKLGSTVLQAVVARLSVLRDGLREGVVSIDTFATEAGDALESLARFAEGLDQNSTLAIQLRIYIAQLRGELSQMQKQVEQLYRSMERDSTFLGFRGDLTGAGRARPGPATPPPPSGSAPPTVTGYPGLGGGLTAPGAIPELAGAPVPVLVTNLQPLAQLAPGPDEIGDAKSLRAVTEGADVPLTEGELDAAATDLAKGFYLAEKAAESWTEPVRVFGMSLEEAARVALEWGQGLLNLAATASSTGSKAINSLVGLGTAAVGALSGNLAQAFEGLMQFLQPFIEALQPILEPLNDAFMNLLQAMSPLAAVIGQILAAFAPLIDAVAIWLTPFVRILALTLAPLVPIIQLVGRVFKFVAELVAGIWNAIANAINAVLGWLGVHLETIDLSTDEAEESLDSFAKKLRESNVPEDLNAKYLRAVALGHGGTPNSGGFPWPDGWPQWPRVQTIVLQLGSRRVAEVVIDEMGRIHYEQSGSDFFAFAR